MTSASTKPSSLISGAEVKKDNRLAYEANYLDRWSKQVMLTQLKNIASGRIVIEDGVDVYEFGESAETASIVAHIHIHHLSVWKDILMRGSIGAGEAYILGLWTSPDLTKVIRIFSSNLDVLDALDGRVSSLRGLIVRVGTKAIRSYHKLRENSKEGSRGNISAHYDLGNSFFKLFLDSTMMYSSAIFENEKSSLYEASVNKLDRICKKLFLNPNDHVVEIGSGWGGFAIHAAKNYGCRVTTTTISKEQYDFAVQKVNEEGLSDRITVLFKDYRDMEGQYDKLVSIEMIEAVGQKFYRSYFEKCSSLLKPNGLMLIQAITIPEQRFEQACKSVDFIQRYIFPGGCLPSVAVVSDFVCRYTNLSIVGLEDITEHYAQTLLEWRKRFHNSVDEVIKQGFDEVFIRMWDFYLCYCEGGFRERSIGTSQILFAKPRFRGQTLLGQL